MLRDEQRDVINANNPRRSSFSDDLFNESESGSNDVNDDSKEAFLLARSGNSGDDDLEDKVAFIECNSDFMCISRQLSDESSLDPEPLPNI